MVGGLVRAVLDCGNRVWVNCRESHCYRRSGCMGNECPHDECAIYVERTPDSLQIKAGDKLWWQGGEAYWTPVPVDLSRVEIPIKRRGFSGVRHPARALIESAYGDKP